MNSGYPTVPVSLSASYARTHNPATPPSPLRLRQATMLSARAASLASTMKSYVSEKYANPILG